MRARTRPAPPARPTKITKSICHQCPARCGIDVYTTDGRVHAIYGSSEHPISNGKLCPKGPLGTYILYDPDRFKGPMKRTNPKKGRDEDPGSCRSPGTRRSIPSPPGSTPARQGRVAPLRAVLRARLGRLLRRAAGPFGKLYGSPNVPIGHSSMCSDGSIISKQATDGNASYSAYDYRNANMLLMFGVGFLEAFRPYNNNMQVWGYIRGERAQDPHHRVDVHLNTTLAGGSTARC
jgi:thiosulfate reductase/polysulfide reductase chain A